MECEGGGGGGGVRGREGGVYDGQLHCSTTGVWDYAQRWSLRLTLDKHKP